MLRHVASSCCTLDDKLLNTGTFWHVIAARIPMYPDTEPKLGPFWHVLVARIPMYIIISSLNPNKLQLLLPHGSWYMLIDDCYVLVANFTI